MHHHLRVLFALLLLVVCGASCDSGTASTDSSGQTGTAIALNPATLTLAVGTSAAVKATLTLTDMTTQDISSLATWLSSDPTIATVSATGSVTGVKAGSATITAQGAAPNAALSGTLTVAVTNAQPVSIGVTPAAPNVARGTTTALQATATFSDMTTQDVTAQADWTSSAAATASVDDAASKGLVTGVADGTATITATLGAIAGTTTVTVTGAMLTAIALTPPTPTLAKGFTTQLTATGTFSDMTTQDITSQVTWTSATAANATVGDTTSKGLVTAVAVGTADISATLMGIVGTTTVTVSPAVLVTIGVTPGAPSVAKGAKQQFTAMGVYSDATKQDLTTQVTWASGTTATATISNAAGTQGLATALVVGTTTITATVNGVTSTGVTLTVTAAAVVSIGVTPAAPSIAKGLTQQFVAMATYSDTTVQDVSATATWASATTATATISNAGGSHGLATALAIGTTSITASLSGVTSPGVTLTVTAATLVSIAVTPATPSIAKGLTQQFTAMGTYTDATLQNLTTMATWVSGTIATATISNAGGSQGLATSAAVGTTSITATFGGKTSPAVTLTVTPAALLSIAVTPGAPSVAKGTPQQFTAMGTYTDASMQNLTTMATWASGTIATATISNAGGSQGLATTLAIGTTAITATLSGVTSPSVTLTVTAATLASIAVTPGAPSVAKGLPQQFTAMGTYTDATMQNLTTMATWASGTMGTATISNAGGSQGLAATLAVGTTAITATFGGKTSPAVTLTVTAAAVMSIAVTPVAPSIAKGLTQQFVAMGTYTDATMQPLTTLATWASGTMATATISNAGGSQGLATGLAIGTTAITATYTGVTSPAATLTVTAATLNSITVTPATPTVLVSSTQQFVATGNYTDGAHVLTTMVTWASSDMTKATISNTGGSNGLATTTASAGTTTISATLGLTGSTVLTVTVVVGGQVGPTYPGWAQCVGYLDVAGSNDIPDTGWADSCKVVGTTKLRLACGANAGSVRYIDVSKNVFIAGLLSYPETGLITNSNFALGGNDIYASGNQPNTGTSWWVTGNGCDESSASLTINNGCSWEAADCFGQNLAGSRFLYVYTAP